MTITLGTTPAAVMRARGLLTAWGAGDDYAFREILRIADVGIPDEPAAFVNTTVALVAVADRLMDYITGLPEPHPGAHDPAALLTEVEHLLITALQGIEGNDK